MLNELQRSKMMNSPQAIFNHPKEVLQQQGLSLKDKKDILINWKSQCVHMSESDSEGMLGDTSIKPRKTKELSQVVNALDRLEAQERAHLQ